MPSQLQYERTTWFSVVRAYQVCTKRYDELLARFDLTSPQYEVLSTVERLGADAQPKRIAAALLVSRGNITGILDRLTRRGLIELVRHPADGRARLVHLTRSAHRLMEQVRPATREFIRVQMAPFSETEMSQVRGLMQRMEAHLEAMDPDRIAATRGAASETRPAGRSRESS